MLSTALSIADSFLSRRAYLGGLYNAVFRLHPDTTDSRNVIHRRLPLEIMSYIFELCMPESGVIDDGGLKLDKDRSTNAVPLLLGSVCKAWNDIVWSTPQLWTTLTIVARETLVGDQCSRLAKWLAHSGRLPLTITFFGNPNKPGRDRPGYGDLIQMLNSHSERWKSLTLLLPGAYWSLFTGNGRPADCLRILHLVDTCPYNNREKSFRFKGVPPSPQDVWIDLRCARLSSICISWKNVKSLNISSLMVQEWLEILREAANLEHCSISTSGGLRHAAGMYNNTYVYSPIQGLEMVNREIDMQPYLNCLCFPSLRNITWKWGTFPISAISSLLQRSCCVLTELVMTDITFNEDDLVPFLKQLESLRYLKFVPSSGQDFDPEELFESLSSTSMLRGSTSGDTFLPELRVLHYARHFIDDIPWRHLPGIFGQISDLRNPRRRPLHTLQIHVTEGGSYDAACSISHIQPSTLRRIYEIRRAGLELEVTCGFDWGVVKDLVELATKHRVAKQRCVLIGRLQRRKF